MNKIIFSLFLSLSLYGMVPFKIEKKYYDYEKYNNYDCIIKSKLIYFYKNKFTGSISKNEYYDMTYRCYHTFIYLKPGDYAYTSTTTPCRCEDNGLWIDNEGNLN